jgi:hypothetical protein
LATPAAVAAAAAAALLRISFLQWQLPPDPEPFVPTPPNVASGVAELQQLGLLGLLLEQHAEHHHPLPQQQ